jgi:spore germination protein GerM
MALSVDALSTMSDPSSSNTPNRWMVPVLILMLGLLVAAFIFIKPGPKPDTPETPTATLFDIYFSQARGSDMVVNPVRRAFKAPLEAVVIERRIKWAVEKLCEGPSPEEAEKGFMNELPTGTTVKKVTAQGDDIYIEMSPEFAESGGANSIQQRVSQLQKTIQAVPGLKNPVHLMIDGKVVTTLGGEGLEVDDPLVPAP